MMNQELEFFQRPSTEYSITEDRWSWNENDAWFQVRLHLRVSIPLLKSCEDRHRQMVALQEGLLAAGCQ